MTSLLLLLAIIWLLILTVRYNRLEQIIKTLETRLNLLQREQGKTDDDAPRQPVAQQPVPQHTQVREAPDGRGVIIPSVTPKPAKADSPEPAPAYRNEYDYQPEHRREREQQYEPQYQPEYTSEPLWPRIRPVLVATGLWPDTRKGSLEAQLTTFIATRLGIILGVAALVFLAVYVGRYTPVWIRFIELLLVPTALCVLARVLRNRVPAFARVVLAGAMAMFYFASFAAHAVPGVRIIEEAWLGFAVQIATLFAIGAFAARRSEQPIAVLTQSLGFVACAFALYHGLTTYLLSGCFLLGTGGALLYASRRWRTCLWLGMAGTYGFYLLIISDAHRLGTPANWVQWLYPLFAYLMFFAGDRLTAMRLQLPQERVNVIHHSVNTALALLAGFVAIREFQPGRLEYFYLGATLVAAGCVWSFRQKPVSEWLAHQFTLKASVLFSLFLLEVLDGNLRCIALLLQALALLEGARRHPSKATVAAAVVAWLFSLGAVLQIHFVSQHALWQITTFWIGLYLFGSGCLLLQAGRVLPRNISHAPNHALQLAGGILLGIAAILTTFYRFTNGTEGVAAALINLLLLLAPLLAFLPAVAKRQTADRQFPNPFLGIGVAIGIALLWAHIAAWYLLKGIPYTLSTEQQWWIGGIAAVSVALVLFAGFCASKSIRAAQHVLLIITSYTVYALIQSLISDANLLLAMAVTGWLLVLLCALPRYRHLTYARLIPFALATVYLFDAQVHKPELTATAALWSALALAFLWQLTQPYWKALSGGYSRNGTLALQWTQATLLVFAALLVTSVLQDALSRIIVLGSFTLVALCLHRIRLPHLWLMQALVLLGVAQAVCAQMWLNKADTFATLYPIQIALSALTIWLAQSIRRQLPAEAVEFIAAVQTVGGLVALLPLLAVPMELLAARTWLSLWYALPAFALIITGLVLHGRPYRLIGLIALLLPLGRLFAYDIRDTVQRIIAFGLLAVVLLLTGYIYNRVLEGGRRGSKAGADTADEG